MSRDSAAPPGPVTPPAPVAFGRWAVPLLSEQLRLPRGGARLRALAALTDVLQRPLRATEALNAGMWMWTQSLRTVQTRLKPDPGLLDPGLPRPCRLSIPLQVSCSS